MMVETVLSRSVRMICAGGMALGMSAAYAQQAEVIQKVEVTGSRIPSAALEGTSPVTVLSAKEIKTDGVRNVESLLNNLPQVFADQGGNVVNGSSGTATVNLRGLGADRTLVLVNGRRMPQGSPANTAADLNQIPAPLIKRIEVLTGGAGAVYGADAVSGVVNFIMNDRFEGVQIEANVSGFNHKQQNAGGVDDLVKARAVGNPANFKSPDDVTFDGKSKDLSLLIGSNFADNKGNATFFFNYKKDSELLQANRDFSACSVNSNAAGFACGGSGTSGTGRFTDLKTGRAFTTNAAGVPRLAVGTDAYNFGPLNHYQRPSERYGFNGAVRYDIKDNMRLYGDFGFHDDRTVAQIAPGGLFGVVANLRFDNPLLTPEFKNAFGLRAPGDSAEVIIQRRNIEGGGRQSEFRNTSFRSVVGLKGEVGNWNYDLFAQVAKVIYGQSEQNYFLSSRGARALDVVNVNGVATCASVVNGTDPNCVPYNPYRVGGVTQAQLDYLQAPGIRKGSTQQEIQGANIAADLGVYGIKMPTSANGVGISMGVERRVEKLELATDSATQAGDLSGSGGATGGVVGQYKVEDIFGEVKIPLMENRPFVNLLSVNASYRHSKITNPNNSVGADTYGVGIEYSPISQVRFRGSYQKAVRAPNLVELFTPSGNNLYDNDEDPCAGATPTLPLATCARTGVTAAQYGKIQDSPAGQYNFLQGGNPNLRPENAESKTFGVVLTPMRNLSVTVDYFDIKITDTISILDPASTLAKCLANGEARFCSLIQRDRTGSLWLLDEGRIIGTNVNIGGSGTSGLDLGFNYAHKLANLGSLGVSATGTYLRSLYTEEIEGEGAYDCVGLYGANKCGAPNAEWRHKVRANWNTPWNLDLALTWRHIGEVALQNTSDQILLKGNSNAVDRVLGKRDYFDLAASYKLTPKITLSGGINNLFDKDPPITSQLSTGQGNGNTYPSIYDALGRRLFMNLTAKF